MGNEIWTQVDIEKMQHDLLCYESEIQSLRNENKELRRLLDRCDKEARAAADAFQEVKDESDNATAEYAKKIAFLEGQIEAYQYALNSRR